MKGKRLLSLAMAAILSTGIMAGCGGSTEGTAVESSLQVTEAPAETEAPTEAEAEAPVASGNPMTALELAEIMGNGINLGKNMLFAVNGVVVFAKDCVCFL